MIQADRPHQFLTTKINKYHRTSEGKTFKARIYSELNLQDFYGKYDFSFITWYQVNTARENVDSHDEDPAGLYLLCNETFKQSWVLLRHPTHPLNIPKINSNLKQALYPPEQTAGKMLRMGAGATICAKSIHKDGEVKKTLRELSAEIPVNHPKIENFTDKFFNNIYWMFSSYDENLTLPQRSKFDKELFEVLRDDLRHAGLKAKYEWLNLKGKY